MEKKKFKPKGTWRAKLEKNTAPEVKEGPENWNARFGGDRMLIASPKLVDEKVCQIPAGKILTMGKLRAALAADFDADYSCPLTTGIFLRICAEAAEEALREGAQEISPWWRVIQDEGTLNPKLPGAGVLQAERLQAEGWVIVPKGKTKVMVRDFEKFS